MAVSTKMAVFLVVAPCSLVEVYHRFRGPCCLHLQGDASDYQTTQSYNPEDSHLNSKHGNSVTIFAELETKPMSLQLCRAENLKSIIKQLFSLDSNIIMKFWTLLINLCQMTHSGNL
jgi:hypothetical protein